MNRLNALALSRSLSWRSLRTNSAHHRTSRVHTYALVSFIAVYALLALTSYLV